MDKRLITQLTTAILSNSYIIGFIDGKIYKGDLKRECFPGLNCYSCPGALGSCPIGALQAVVNSFKYDVSLYVIGFISFVGILFGRLICGYICPFGLIQDLLYKIPTKKIKVNSRLNNVLKYLKYVILVIFVFLLPIFLVDEFGLSSPAFCKYICPAGTLEGGIPLLLTNPALRESVGFLFTWKMFILILVIISSIFIYRPFCRYICPLGALYSIFNPISFFRYEIDSTKCTSCKTCMQKCKLDINVYKNPNSLECIRCGECIKACPNDAIVKKLGEYTIQNKTLKNKRI